MKKILIALCVLAVLFTTVSCASSRFSTAKSQNKGVVGLNGIKRPDWVLYDISTKNTHYVTGYGTGMTMETAKYKAKLAADSELALWINTTVDSMRDRYLAESTVNADQNFVDQFVLSAREAGKAVLSGVRVEDFWQDGEGGYYILESIPVKNVKAQVEAAIQSTATDPNAFSNAANSEDVLKRLNAILNETYPEN